MGKRTSYEPGTFSWTELATPDPVGAKEFYGSVFGWESEDAAVGDATIYTMLRVDGDDVAALYEQSPEQQAAGIPPSWLCHVTVDSADAVAARAAELGGAPLGEPFDVMEYGRMALIQDPAGATLALWEPRASIGATRVNDPGCMCWNDLVTPDPAAAVRFYGGLLGWEIAEIEGAQGYRHIRNVAAPNGGVMPAELVGGGPPHWLPYFNAGRLDAAIERIEAGGGRILARPRQVPAGRFAVTQDPQGATFALFEGEVDP